MISKKLIKVPIVAVLMLIPGIPNALDWSAAPSKEMTLFFPGELSWEKVLTSDTHAGAAGVRSKNTCQSCHGGDEAQLGGAVAKAEDHISGPTSVDVTLKLAVENDTLYFRIDLPAIKAGQVSLMLDNNSYMHSSLSGCWSACHDDLPGMDSESGLELTKYLSVSRLKNTRTGGSDSYKSDSELTALMEDGQFMEIVGVDISTTAESKPFHGYVLDRRHMASPKGIAAAGLTVDVDTANAMTSVVIGRPLDSALPGVKSLSPSTLNSLAIALHTEGNTNRHHLVSFAVQFSIGADNKIVFVSQ